MLDLIAADPGLALPVIEAANRALAGAGVAVASVEVALGGQTVRMPRLPAAPEGALIAVFDPTAR